MTPQERAVLYNRAFPDRPPLSWNVDWLCGTWCIGAQYKNPNRLHGAYPYGYLKRVHSMFPEAQNILHVFSGGLTLAEARKAAWPFDGDLFDIEHRTMQLVDCKGPEEGRYPTLVCDVMSLPLDWVGRFDLILADPPYTTHDAEIYGTPMPNRAAVMKQLRKVCVRGGNLVWLDQMWPMHSSLHWKCWAHIGLVRSTNHRVRLVSMFTAV